MHFVCLIVKLLKRLRIEHTDEEIEQCVVRIRDDAKDGLFPFAQLAQLHIVAGGDVLNLRQRERRKTDSSTHQDALSCFARSLLENMVLPHGNVVRLFFLQGFKE